MTEIEGVIKYRLDYRPGDLPGGVDLRALQDWFSRCRAYGLIGRDPQRYQGLAFGNISQRAATGFVISGTQTGALDALRADQLAWVKTFDPDRNTLSATGPAWPSSEAMTHGQVYRALRSVGAVIHAHSPAIWRHADALGIPKTAESAAYGTPEMAAEVTRLLDAVPTADHGLFAMGGHEDGVVAFARDMASAGRLLLATEDRARRLANRRNIHA